MATPVQVLRAWSRRVGTALAVGFAAVCLPLPAPAATEIVSRSSAGVQGNSRSQASAISADGRYVLIWSEATNLVDGDTNAVPDLFLHDRTTGATTIVSSGAGGVLGDAETDAGGVLSASGRFVAFDSLASNLVAGDTNGAYDVFLRDRARNTIRRISVSSARSQADNDSYPMGVTPDGRFTVFGSAATNLVPGDTNGFDDVFVHDRVLRTTTRVSRGPRGAWGNAASFAAGISANGRYVSFSSEASNLVRNDTNAARDCFVHDRWTRRTTLVSRNAAGAQGDGESRGCFISANGAWIVFTSAAANLVPGDTNAADDVFLRNLGTGRTIRVSATAALGEGNAFSTARSISGSGRFVAFDSAATNLVADDTNGFIDVFVFDRRTGEIRRVNVDGAGQQANNGSSVGKISADGSWVAFTSAASNLVPGDAFVGNDAFVAGPLR